MAVLLSFCRLPVCLFNLHNSGDDQLNVQSSSLAVGVVTASLLDSRHAICLWAAFSLLRSFCLSGSQICAEYSKSAWMTDECAWPLNFLDWFAWLLFFSPTFCYEISTLLGGQIKESNGRIEEATATQMTWVTTGQTEVRTKCLEGGAILCFVCFVLGDLLLYVILWNLLCENFVSTLPHFCVDVFSCTVHLILPTCLSRSGPGAALSLKSVNTSYAEVQVDFKKYWY